MDFLLLDQTRILALIMLTIVIVAGAKTVSTHPTIIVQLMMRKL